MTVELFVTLAATAAVVTLAAVDLRVPFAPLRRWAERGRHIEASSPDGPWFVVEWDQDLCGFFRASDEAGDPVPHATEAAARAHLSAGQRARAWLAEMLGCPWCCGAWVSAFVLAAAAPAHGAGVLVFWPALWWWSSFAATAARRVAG